MSKEKQIEEMALTEVDILANDLNQHCADLAEDYCGGITCLSCLAHGLIEKGYRKQSDVAREIFEEIEDISSDFPIYGNINTVILSERDLAFIKKKYTESEKDDG